MSPAISIVRTEQRGSGDGLAQDVVSSSIKLSSGGPPARAGDGFRNRTTNRNVPRYLVPAEPLVVTQYLLG